MLFLLFFVSGAAALVYEVVWARGMSGVAFADARHEPPDSRRGETITRAEPR
ncbi:MAG TPA: hypothetical protein VM683_14490 [Anaeromyxobacteraceae bacterium]|nr:hypothetical protein [Anaeromyxobacteraceae bacterium]